ncbi:FliH/SctL family protein [Aneurinibacillus sp. Ricciae_BoGa-3]|uniref:FliH/SctL family protein n=1 Tax=Aneurinibacillus sp. Ricciae_BoGa-3 TaxID=3022697 RepID=UPI002340A1FF|nr:FliH/SctL family protein [Aneurinibacillus sp. Ricciae_BoGa-3]WCK52899.1 FliH/SctL family protein [Aneurinibacillus sp. Ricciae_BoGa-3]
MSRIIKSAAYSAINEKYILPLTHKSDKERENSQNHHLSPEDIGGEDPPFESEEAAVLIQQAKIEAEAILRRAREQADRLAEESRQEINLWWEQRRQEDEEVRRQIKEEGYQQGLDQGRRDGEQAAYDEYITAINEARAMLEEAPLLKRKMISEAEPFILELTMGIAKKVIYEHLGDNPDSTIRIIKEALARTQEYKTLTVCVNPDVYPYVQENRLKLLESLDSQIELTIVPDHTVADGGCVVRTSLGSVDARVDTQLEEIKEALFSLAIENEEHSDV